MSSTTPSKAMTSSRDLLHGYQATAVQRLLDNPKYALWLDMGLGKTVITLTAISDLFLACEITRVLVVAPPRVCKHVWPAEIEKWPHLQHLSYCVLDGRPKERDALLKNDTSDVHLLSRDLVKKVFPTLKARWPYDMVVIDEASGFKSHTSQRWRAAKAVLPNVDRVVELTGTPGRLLDLWAMIYLLDGGDRLGKVPTGPHGYRERYFESDFMGYNWTPRKGSKEQIEDRISDIVMSMSAKDYLELPDCVHNTVPVIMPPTARKGYTELEKEFLLELEGADIEAVNAAVLTGKLLQYANGAVYDENGDTVVMHSAKLTALEELVVEINEPMLVAYNFKSDLARLKETFPHAVTVDEKDAIERWNRGEIDMLLAHPASAGHGLNLQAGGRVLVWYGLNWSLELYQQFNARLHRQGQTKPVIVHHLVVMESIDEAVMQALDMKLTEQNALLDAVKMNIRGRV